MTRELDNEPEIEYRKRLDLVLGITLAGILSFFINIFANIYYDVFVVNTVEITSYSEGHMVFLLSTFFATIAFLQFLIIDYGNKLHFEKSFWARYFMFLSGEFVITRIAVKVQRALIGFFLLLFIIGIFLSVESEWSILAFAVVVTLSALILIARDRLKLRNMA